MSCDRKHQDQEAFVNVREKQASKQTYINIHKLTFKPTVISFYLIPAKMCR